MEYTSFDDLKNLLGTEVSGRRVYKSSFQTKGLGLKGFGGTMMKKYTSSMIGSTIIRNDNQAGSGDFGD